MNKELQYLMSQGVTLKHIRDEIKRRDAWVEMANHGYPLSEYKSILSEFTNKELEELEGELSLMQIEKEENER